jgi:hypothetical protein
MSNQQLCYKDNKLEQDITLKKKRRYSMKANPVNRRMGKKIPRNGHRTNPYDNSDEHKANDDREEEDCDKELCIPSCLLGRKYQEGNDRMIACDRCENWYHPKCIKMSDDEFETAKNSDDWICSDCKNLK